MGGLGKVHLYAGTAPGPMVASFDADQAPDPSCRNAEACRAPIGALAFSPDGVLLAFQEISHSGLQRLNHGFVYVVDVSTGNRVAKLEAVAGTPRHVSFSPDGRRLVAMHYRYEDGRRQDMRFRVWDTSTWELLDEVGDVDSGLGHEIIATGTLGGVDFAAVYPKGGRLEMRNLESDMRNLESDRIVWSVPLFSPPFEPSSEPVPWPLETTLHEVAVAPNGEFIVTYEGPGPIAMPPVEDVGSIVVRDARDGAIRAAYEIHDVTDLKISPDSATFVYTVGFHQTYIALARVGP